MIFHRQPAKSRSRYRTLVYPSPLNPPLCVPTIRCGKSITLETTSGKLRRHVSPCRGSRDSSRWSCVLVVRFVSADGQTLARTIYTKEDRDISECDFSRYTKAILGIPSEHRSTCFINVFSIWLTLPRTDSLYLHYVNWKKKLTEYGIVFLIGCNSQVWLR